jgi:hypothetical protein
MNKQTIIGILFGVSILFLFFVFIVHFSKTNESFDMIYPEDYYGENDISEQEYTNTLDLYTDVLNNSLNLAPHQLGYVMATIEKENSQDFEYKRNVADDYFSNWNPFIKKPFHQRMYNNQNYINSTPIGTLVDVSELCRST